MLKHIPNLFTLGNLFCGLLAILFAIGGHLNMAGGFIILGAFLDFFDGMLASGSVWGLNAIIEWFEENKPPKEEYYNYFFFQQHSGLFLEHLHNFIFTGSSPLFVSNSKDLVKGK